MDKTIAEPASEIITSLEDLFEPIKVIMSLGTEVPAIPGLTVHILTIHYYYPDAPDLDSADSWVYSSYEAAYSGLREWILRHWEVIGKAPYAYGTDWSNPGMSYAERESRYLKHNSDKELVEAYFNRPHNRDTFEIKEEKVEGAPVRGNRGSLFNP